MDPKPHPDQLFNRLIDHFFVTRCLICRSSTGLATLNGRLAFVRDGSGIIGLLEVSNRTSLTVGYFRQLDWMRNVRMDATADTVHQKRKDSVTISTWSQAMSLIE